MRFGTDDAPKARDAVVLQVNNQYYPLVVAV